MATDAARLSRRPDDRRVNDPRLIAWDIERRHPWWVVFFGASSRQFTAFSAWFPGVWLRSVSPDELSQMLTEHDRQYAQTTLGQGADACGFVLHQAR
jgi:hypothetical protein